MLWAFPGITGPLLSYAVKCYGGSGSVETLRNYADEARRSEVAQEKSQVT